MQKKILKILIIGAGGHAQVVADIIRLDPKNYRAIGFIDVHIELHGKMIQGIPVLGSSELISETLHDGLVVAIGNNQTRANVFSKLVTQGENLINAIHPSAVIANDVSLGQGVVICAGVTVNPGAVIHNNVILNTHCSVDHHNEINDHVHIAPGCVLGGDVSVGEGTLIGIGATVMPQKKIGSWSKIGAGAVVTKDIPDQATAVGIPAEYTVNSLEEG